VILDARSLADNIDFSLLKDEGNVLTTYFGTQVLEEWGFSSMVKLISCDPLKETYIASTSPLRTPQGTINFYVRQYRGYRHTKKSFKTFPDQGSFIIGYGDFRRKDFTRLIR
jgi:hypothetical protein